MGRVGNNFQPFKIQCDLEIKLVMVPGTNAYLILTKYVIFLVCIKETQTLGG